MMKLERGYSIVETLLVILILGLAIGTIFSIAELSGRIWSEGKVASELTEDTRHALHMLISEITESSLATIFLGPSSTGPPYNTIGIGHAKRNPSTGWICLDSANDNRIIWDKFVIYHTYNSGGVIELRRTELDEIITGTDLEVNWYDVTDLQKRTKVDSYVNSNSGSEIIKNLQAGGSGLLSFSDQEPDQWNESDFSDVDIAFNNTVVSGGNVVLDGGGQAWFAGSQSGDAIPDDFNNSGAAPSTYRILIKKDDIFKSGSKVMFKFITSPTGTGDYGLDITSPSLAETDPDNFRNIIDTTPPPLYFNSSTSKTMKNNATAWTDWLTYEFNKDTNYSLTYYTSDTIYSIERFNVRKWVDGSGIIDPTPKHEFLWSGNHASTLDWDTNGTAQSYLVALEEIEVGYCSSGTVTSQIYNTGVDDPTYDTISWDATVPLDTTLTMELRSSDEEDMGTSTWSTVTNGQDISTMIGAGRYVQFQAAVTSDSPSYTKTPVLENVTVTWEGGIIRITIDRYYNYRGKDYTISMTSDVKPKNK